MKIRNAALVACIAFAMTACATEETATKADPAKILDVAALKKVFKGGGDCKWTAGNTKGEDFYLTSTNASSGDADRMIGDNVVSGKWALKDNQLCLNFGKEECSTFEEIGKKKYKATFGGTTYEMGC